MNHIVVAKDELPHSGSAHRFEGYLYGGEEVSFFISATPPGKGPSLHTHPYAEVFVVQEGELTFTVGGDTIEATGGQIVVAPAGAPTSSLTRAPDGPGTWTSTLADGWIPSGSRKGTSAVETTQHYLSASDFVTP